MSDVDYYEILGVDPEAETDEIDQAFERKLASEPGQAPLLVEARAVLLDPTARAEYDARCVGQELIDETVAAIMAAHPPHVSALD